MEKEELDKIRILSPKLIELIDCNVALVAYLRATNTIALADEHQLMALLNKSERSKSLLNILCTRNDGYKFLVEGLTETKQSGSLELLKRPIQVDSRQHEIVDIPFMKAQNQSFASTSTESGIRRFKKVPFHSKEATQLFSGRHKQLRILLESLLPDGGTASITGMGGIGKTELAKMFLQKLDEETNKNVFQQMIWINCESSFTATTDFTTIAKDYLKVPIFSSSNHRREITSILNDVYEKLAKSKSLVILDNVETTEILQTYLPQPSTISKLSILITSQTFKRETHVPLDGLDLPEAAEFVKKGLHIPGPLSEELENGILELVKRLQMLPLAISQAIGYITEKREMHLNYGPHDYLMDLDRIPLRIFDRKSFNGLSSNGKTIYKTLDLALSKIQACETSGELASKILSKVAFMAPDNIPSSLFSELAENDNDALEEALIFIRRFSIIKYTPVDRKSTVYFGIHRLVQDVLRIRIDQDNQTQSSIHSTLELLRCHLNYELNEHAIIAWKHVQTIQKLVEIFSDFPFEIALQMSKNGRISDAYDFSASALILLKQKLSIKEHASTIFWLQSYNNCLLFEQGRLDESLEKLEATFNEAKKFLPDGDQVISDMQYCIAQVYYARGQNEKGALLCDEMCEGYKLHKTVSLKTLITIAELQNNLHRFKDAQKTTKHILEHLNLISEEPRELLEFDMKCLMANIHGGMGNYPECLSLYTEIVHTFLKDRKNMFSNFARWSLFHFMGLYQYLAGLFEEAHDSNQKALNEMNGLKESDSAALILQTKCRIAAVMLARNMVDEALPFAIEVYEQTKQMFGKKSSCTLDSLANIGVAYSKVGWHHDAVKILTQLTKNENYEFKLEKYYLALSLERIGRFERSVKILSELRLVCLQYPNYKVFTIEHVDSTLNRIRETRIKQLVFSTVYKYNKLYL